MDNISDWIYHHKTMIMILIILLIGGFGSAYALSFDSISEETMISDVTEPKEESNDLKESHQEEELKKEEITSWRVDIKGAIKNPGVYEVKENTRIYEVIDMAGGLKEQATTSNMNLSKKVLDEMVIYIFSEEEYQKKMTCEVKNETIGEISKEIASKESIINPSNEKETELKQVSLNNATKEELMTLEGIGEAKALSILEYRTQKNGFQKIEELKEVSGIGEALYEKIKNYITL